MSDPLSALASIMRNSPIGQNAMRSVGNNNTVGNVGRGGPQPVTQARVLQECSDDLMALWDQSRPHALPLPVEGQRGLVIPGGNPQTPKNERGCWIFHNTLTDTLRVETWSGARTRDSCTPTAPGPGQNERLVVDFHTHPNVGQEGYTAGPSPDDIAAVGTNVTGLVRSEGKWHWFGKVIPVG